MYILSTELFTSELLKYAKGYFVFFDANGEKLTDGNRNIPTDGWGEDDEFIKQAFLQILGIVN